jgi:limonene-1,2-epoxide hydrolase
MRLHEVEERRLTEDEVVVINEGLRSVDGAAHAEALRQQKRWQMVIVELLRDRVSRGLADGPEVVALEAFDRAWGSMQVERVGVEGALAEVERH